MTSVWSERQENKLQWLGAGSKFTLTSLFDIGNWFVYLNPLQSILSKVLHH